MALRSMYTGISGMKANQTKLDVVANNIANESTTAFKASRTAFSDMLYQNSGEATSPTSNKGGTNAKQVGLGASVSSINKMMGQGNKLATGRKLDVCVDGEGYLIVCNGPVNGKIDSTGNKVASGSPAMSSVSYTRDGNLTLDKDGNLLTTDGQRVMGYQITNGLITYSTTTPITPIIVTGAPADGAVAVANALVPLVIPASIGADKIKDFNIGSDGVITANLSGGSRVAIGQIAMASFTNPEGLTAIGGNMLSESTNSGSALVKSQLGATGTADNSKAFGSINSGTLEASNVDLTEQFTELITATRSFQASSKLISNGDEILQTITGLIR
ncbi:flagellar basal body protein [Clostridium gelidum]|uniref:Flagellar basal body protein n=1 Tax=Clostridium gelidum TaxID=704125 RepID=A0ABM7TBW3_9CLOT|nr:flagellar hook-basal body complex protein [Clostridium gelidum]BCZ48588.1 flagellar basal body protein [Clostridium gelidum]